MPEGHRGGGVRRIPEHGGRPQSNLEHELDVLGQSVEPFGVILGSDTRERLKVFASELLEWNNRLNLLSRSDASSVISKHTAASIGVFLVAPPNTAGRWLDVGTGAGFPGLVLKILAPEIDMTLLDSSRKRCMFLENVVRKTGLKHVPVLPIRIETLVAKGSSIGAYSTVTSRAVASLVETLKSCGPLLCQYGRVVTFKGPQWAEELSAARDAGDLGTFGYVVDCAIRLPWTAGHLLCLRKTAAVREPHSFSTATAPG